MDSGGAARRLHAAIVGAAALVGVGSTSLAAPAASATSASGFEAADKVTFQLQPALQFEFFTQEQGLPNTWVTSIVQDSNGFLWFGTQVGVGRYDGRRMRVWPADPDDPSAIGSSFVTAMAASPAGAVWIGTGDAGLYRYDGATDKLTPFRARADGTGPLAADAVTAILVDSKGRTWVGAGGILHRLDDGTQASRRYALGAKDAVAGVTALVESRDGSLWVGTDVGLCRVDSATGRVLERHDRFAGSSITAVLEDRGGVLWVGTEKGLFRRDVGGPLSLVPAQPGADRGLTDPRVSALLEDAAGNLWVGTEDGLNRLGPSRDRIDRFKPDTNYGFETVSYPREVTTLYQDVGGVIWIGTQIGARKLAPQRERFHRSVMSAATGLGMSFVEDGDGSLWVGTWHTGLEHVDRKSGRIELYRSLGSAERGDFVSLTNWIRALALDERGLLWISEDGVGLIRLDTRTGAHKVYPLPREDPEQASPFLMSLVLDGGFVWIATWGQGLLRFDPAAEEFLDFPEVDGTGLPVTHLYTVQRDRRERSILWLGAAEAGLYRFDTRTQTARHFPVAPRRTNRSSEPVDLSVYHLHQADDRTFWLATDGMGLVKLDPTTGKTTLLSKEIGLQSRVVYGVFPDKKGRLWLPTADKGLGLFDPRTGRTIAFDKSDGAAPIFSMGAFYQSPSGEIFLSAPLDAVLAFRPEEIELGRFAPRLSLVSFKIFGQEAALDRPIWTNPAIQLGFNQSAVSFEFAALTYAAPDRIRYRYRLDGLDADWTETELAFASYTNLEGGDYVFRVETADRDGAWHGSGVALPIRVALPPWKTWWAYALYAAGSLLVILVFVRSQSRRIESARRALRLANAERELEITAAVQAGFLPHANRVALPPFELEGFYRAANRASGDWWWYEPGAEETLAVLVGDVTGHGAASAMVTAAVATAFRLGRLHRVPLAQRMLDLNQTVLEVGRGQYQMTMTSVLLDGRTGEFVFDSAGGEPLMLLGRDGAARFLPCRGTPLGTRQNFEAGRLEAMMRPGERMVLFTDGMPELSIGEKRLLGLRRFARLCEATSALPLDEAITHLVESLDRERRGHPQEDDWTITMVQYSERGFVMAAPREPGRTGSPRRGEPT